MVNLQCAFSIIKHFESVGFTKEDAIVQGRLLRQRVEEYTVRAETKAECVSKMVEHEMESHPKMPQKQALAVAYSKCEERDYSK